MASNEQNQPVEYRVGMTKSLVQRIKLLFRQALKNGQGQSFRNAILTILANLRSRPLEFGEPCFRLEKLQLEIRTGSIAPLVVHYGVHETKPEVFISAIERLT